MDPKGAHRRQLTYIQGGLGESYRHSFDFAWSPDSQKIALSHVPHLPHWEKKPRSSTLNILEIKTTHTQQIASFDAPIRCLSWFPNGEEILFMKERIGFYYDEEEDYEWILSLNIKDGRIRTLAKFDGLQQSLNPTLSSDGKKIAILYDADHPMYDYMLSIGIINNESSLHGVTRLTHELNLSSLQWSHDGQRIYTKRSYGAYRQIYAIDVLTGTSSQITNAPLDIENYALSPDGLQLAWIGQDAQATQVIRVASSEGHNVRDLLILPGVPEDIALSEVREIDWQAPPDYPGRMRGLLFMPLNYKEGTRYPLIVDIHGGRSGASLHLTGGILVNSPLEWHMWAAKGYAVFVPEFRSSASFGSLAITRDELQNYDLVNCDIKDIEAGVKSLIDQKIVDPHRLAVIGYSAGGRRANWLVASTHQFKAVVSKEGWADEWILSLSMGPSKRMSQMLGGEPWEVPQNYLKNSALFHCNGATTPTLFLMGNPDLGGADPSKSVSMLHNALKGQKVETEYVQYSDEGHVFEKKKNKRDALKRAIQWIDRHIGGKE
jgi:dienelactone hydrolase